MRNRLTAVVMALIILLSYTVTAYADENADDEMSMHRHTDITFNIPLSGVLKGSLEAGNYYLTDNCSTVGRLKVLGEVNICLNGYILETSGATTLQVENGGVLSLYDCTGEGHLGSMGPAAENYPLTVNSGATANLFSVILESDAGPMAVNNSGTLNVYDAEIYCKGEKSDSIGIRNIGSVHFYGGKISARIAVLMKSDGSNCVFHAGNTVINGEKTAFSYVSQDRPVTFEGDIQPGIKTDEAGEYVFEDFPSPEQIDTLKYLEVNFCAQDSGEAPDAELDAQEQLISLPEDEPEALKPAENIFEVSPEEKTVIEDELVIYETAERKAAYIVFGVIALFAASGAAVLFIMLKKK